MIGMNSFLTSGGGGGINGSGTPLRIPVWTGANTLGDSQFEQTDQWDWICYSPYGGFLTLDDNNGGGYFYSQSQNISGNYQWAMSLYANDTQFDAFILQADMSPASGQSSQFALQFISHTSGNYDPTVNILGGNATFLQYKRLGQRTAIRCYFADYNYDASYDNYTLFVGGEKAWYNQGGAITTPPDKVFANLYVDHFALMYQTFTFDETNYVGNIVARNTFFTSSGNFILNQPVTGIRTFANVSVVTDFYPTGASSINELSSIQILPFKNINPSGNTVTIGNYYGLLINDTLELSPPFINITGNRYAIYQAGINDKVQFFGLMGFYGATPQAQATTGITNPAWVHNAGGTTLKTVDTILGYTLAQVVQALKNYGLLA